MTRGVICRGIRGTIASPEKSVFFHGVIEWTTHFPEKCGSFSDAQLAMAKSLSDWQPSMQAQWHIFAFRDTLSSSGAFTDRLKLVDIVLTLPVKTASNERMFSTLDRVKNYLRNSCGDERLSDLLSEDANDLDVWDVVDNFARLKSRRYSLIH